MSNHYSKFIEDGRAVFGKHPEAAVAFERLLVDHRDAFQSVVPAPVDNLLADRREAREHEAHMVRQAHTAGTERVHAFAAGLGQALAPAVQQVVGVVAPALAARFGLAPPASATDSESERLEALLSVVERECHTDEEFRKILGELPDGDSAQRFDALSQAAADTVVVGHPSSSRQHVELYEFLARVVGDAEVPASRRQEGLNLFSRIRAWQVRRDQTTRETRESPAPSPEPPVVTPPPFTDADVKTQERELSGPQVAALFHFLVKRGPMPKEVTVRWLRKAGLIEHFELTPFGRAVVRQVLRNGPSARVLKSYGPLPKPEDV